MSGAVSFSTSEPRASARDRRGIWLRELEVVEDVLDVGRETVEVGFEVGGQLLTAGAGAQVAQGEPGGVVEGLAGGLAQGRVLFHQAGGVEGGLHGKDGLLAAFQHRIEAAQHRHRQDDVTVLAAHVQVAQHVVGDAPDVVGYPVQVPVVQRHGLLPPPVVEFPAFCTATMRSRRFIQHAALPQ